MKPNIIYSLINNCEPTSISVSLTLEDLRDFATTVAEEAVSRLSSTAKTPVKWLTADQVCEKLNINPATLWRWNKEGYLTNTKFGHRVRYSEEDVNNIYQAEKGGGVANV